MSRYTRPVQKTYRKPDPMVDYLGGIALGIVTLIIITGVTTALVSLVLQVIL